MEIKEIKKELAVHYINMYHYSKILPRLTKYYLGVFDCDKIIGVVTLGWGTQPLQTIKHILYKDEVVTTDYLEIGKMCFIPEVNNSNIGTQIMATLVKWVRNNTTALFLYTLADGIMGKCGFIYQASNFLYIGKFKTSVYMDNISGEKIHPRSAKTLCNENAKYENKEKIFWLTHNFCEHKNISKINGLMFRYLYPLNKKAKTMIAKYSEYLNNSNPKEKDLIFEKRIENGKFTTIEKPMFNMNVFKYNYQHTKQESNQLQLF